MIAYGNARDLVLGFEVVLADGRILSDLSKLKKNNTGYDLKNLFIGSEGTLGIITAAVLKLFPKPQRGRDRLYWSCLATRGPRFARSCRATWRAARSPASSLSRASASISFWRILTARDVLAKKHAWYVLLELSSQSREGLDDRLLALLEAAAREHIIEDAAIAASLEQRENFWKLREFLPRPNVLRAVRSSTMSASPLPTFPIFLEEVFRAVSHAVPGARLVPFGHVGDGNIHCNISQPIGADRQAFLARWDEINAIVYEIVLAHKGSISAEHGIGQLKRDLLPKVKDKVAMDVMRAIKQTLDPKGILNPGKVL